MYSKFLSLNPEKQNRILNAAIREFALKGYEKASTNEIVREADISKGLLFHYFKNKKQLFLFVYDYCMELCLNEFFEKINFEEKDIFKRLREVAIVKLELLHRHPELIKFFQTIYMENSNEVTEVLAQKKNELIQSSFARIFEGIDISRFKEDIDIKRALNIIAWTFEGFGNSILEKAKRLPSKEVDYEKAFAEGDVYIEIFKDIFYKELKNQE